MPAMPMAMFAPVQSCLTIAFDENDCVCRTVLEITNNCSAPLTAVGFEWCQYDYSTGCPTTIEVGARGYLFMERPGYTALGPQTVTLETQLGSATVPMTLSYEMIHVENGGCSVGSGDSSVALSLLVAIVLVRRRRFGHHPRR